MRTQTSVGKRISYVLLLLTSIIFSLGALSVEPRPDGFHLEWEPVEGAEWYDIYIDDVFRERLPSTELSADVDRLWSWQEYKISFAARDAENRDLDAAFAHEETTGWDGYYRWVAPEGHDTNKGKLKEILYEVITRIHPEYGQYYEVWAHVPEGRMRLYPVMEFDSLQPGWTGFRDPSEHAVTYKVTSEKFNKSSILPKRWRITTFRIDWNMEAMTVETVATMGIKVKTTQYFLWHMNDEGEPEMVFYIDAPGFIKNFLTLNEDGNAVVDEFHLAKVR